MSLRRMSVNTSAGAVEDALYAMTDGTERVVAVEVFDSCDSRYDEDLGADVGPWVLGPEREVYDFLAIEGYEDYAEQYSAP